MCSRLVFSALLHDAQPAREAGVEILFGDLHYRQPPTTSATATNVYSTAITTAFIAIPIAAATVTVAAIFH